FRKTQRMPRHEHEQRFRVYAAYRAMSFEHQVFFAAVRTAGDPYRAAGSVELAQLATLRLYIGRQREIELQIAGDVRALGIGAERAETGRVGFTLCRDDSVREHLPEQGDEAAIAPHRARRKPCAREHEWDASPPALVVEIRPQLRFEDDGDA